MSLFKQVVNVGLKLFVDYLSKQGSTPQREVTRHIMKPQTGLETVQVKRVIDGDTIDLSDGRRVRYLGINTPERESAHYQAAVDLNRRLLQSGEVWLEFDVEQSDQYGRTLAYIWAGDLLVNQQLLEHGVANVLFVPPNGRYTEPFQQAEAMARQGGAGIWQRSSATLKIVALQANAPGRDDENPNGEWVDIHNTGSTAVDLHEFTLKDRANNCYTFGHFSLKAGQRVRLYSGTGRDSAEALYWGFIGDSVWNNEGDTAYLRDADGALVDQYQYGD